MRKVPISLQDLRRRIYTKAKAEPSWRFWGLYVHISKRETLHEAYRLAKANDGAPGRDGVTFEAIEASGVEGFLAQIQHELVTRTYQPMRYRSKAIPKSAGQGERLLLIPTIRDRVVQGALKRILAPIFEAEFQPGSYGYRPHRSAHDAVERVAQAIAQYKTRIYKGDLRAYFDNIRHHKLLEKVARRVNDADVLSVLRLILKAAGTKGVAQGGPLSPLLSNLYLSEVDEMLERAQEVTRQGKYTYSEYARFADDVVIVIDAYAQHDWLLGAVDTRLRQELATLQIEINEAKSRGADLSQGDSVDFLGFNFRRVRSRTGVWQPLYTPTVKKRTALLKRLKEVFRRHRSQPVRRVIEIINPILRGWTNYFAIGASSRCFGSVRDWVEKKVRRHLMRARKRPGFGWKRWSRQWLSSGLGLFGNSRIRRRQPRLKALPV